MRAFSVPPRMKWGGGSRRALCKAAATARTAWTRIPSDVPYVLALPMVPRVDECRATTGRELVKMLSDAGFVHLGTPAPLELKPPSARALEIRVRSTRRLRPLSLHEQVWPPAPWRNADGAQYAYHIAVRGTTEHRTEGLLFGAKLRALEVAYRAPIARLFDGVRRLLGIDKDVEAMHEKEGNSMVKRAAPAGDVWDLFRYGESIEPAYENVVVLYAPRNSTAGAWWRLLRLRSRQALFRALHPAAGAGECERCTHDLPLRAIRVELYRDVPWGELHHYAPTAAQTVLPRPLDLLRVDALTLTTFASALATYFRDAQSPFVGIALVSTVVVYATRIGVGLSTALSGYRGRIDADKFSRVVAKDELAVQAIVEMLRAQNGGSKSVQR